MAKENPENAFKIWNNPNIKEDNIIDKNTSFLDECLPSKIKSKITYLKIVSSKTAVSKQVVKNNNILTVNSMP